MEPRPAEKFAEGAGHFWQDGGYLPPQDDQSWREQDAQRIVTAGQPVTDAELADVDAFMDEAVPQSEFAGFGRVEFFFAFFTAAAIALLIVALTVPDILTADSWRPHAPASPIAKSASPPQRLAAIPAPELERAPAPLSPPAQGPRSDSNGKANAEAARTPAPETAMMQAPNPEPRPAPHVQAREKARDERGGRDAGGFYARVAQPDGTLAYQYFPSNPRLDPQPAVPAVPRDNRGTGGFYAMVAGPGGALEYKYFPPKLAR